MSSNRKRCSRTWGYFFCFLLLCRQRPFQEMHLVLKKKKKEARCSGTERGVGRKRQQGMEVCDCLGLGLFLSDRLILATQGRQAAEKNQRGTGDPGLLWALKCLNSMQQSSTGCSGGAIAGGVRCCLCSFPEAVGWQGR